MSAHSSGYYSIDTEFNIVGFNETAKEIYPSLVLGQKCHKTLMGLDAPCPVCPVVHGVFGPKTYLDPIRHIYETVDAVKTLSPDGRQGYALVFSTVDEGERLSSAIPTGENSLRLLGAINLLASKYATVLGVSTQTRRASVYRCSRLFGSQVDPLALDGKPFEEITGLLISQYVHPDDRAYFCKALGFDQVCSCLRERPSFKVHFRVQSLEEVHYYYLLIARNGDEQDFEGFVVAVACEDDDVNARQVYEKQLRALLDSITDAAGFFHMDVTEDSVLSAGGTSAYLNDLVKNCTIDALMQDMATYIPREKDRLLFLEAYNRENMRREYEAGQVEIVRESRCKYDDQVVRWSRYNLRLLVNPSNNHLEGVFYGCDVTQDRQARETQLSIIQALSSNYLDVFLIDTRDRTAYVIKHDVSVPTAFPCSCAQTISYEELVRSYVDIQVHPDDRLMMNAVMKLSNVLDELAKANEYAGNYRILQQGETHYYQFRFIRNEEYGTVVLGFLNVDSIVTEEIAQQQRLQQALEAARRANSEKSLFLARMSHDMRTPLNGIVGLLQIDKRHENDVEYLKESRRKATLVADHLVSLINDVLDMAKIEDGSLTLAHEPFNILAEGEEAMTLISLQAQEAGISTQIHAVSDMDERYVYVYGSPLHLRRAMMNIYNNCIKYNKPNGKVMTDIEVLPDGPDRVTYRWTIRDTGIGMSQDFLKRIFDPFVQAGTDARSIYQGTGLGMSIAKALIEQMGGTLQVDSELGVGSTFVVTIPFDVADQRAITPQPACDTASVRGMNVLLVEDNDLNREIAETILLEEGARVTSAVNGQEALDCFMASPENTFDLILMDVMMPVMGGYEATQAIRRLNRPDAASIPIIAMTANAFSEDIARSLQAGMNAHIAKPVNVDKMLKLLAQYKTR